MRFARCVNERRAKHPKFLFLRVSVVKSLPAGLRGAAPIQR
jgi:hypothetical protein